MMLMHSRKKLLYVLMALLALTLVSWLLIYIDKLSPAQLGVSILLLAFVKVRLIIMQYMEVAAASLPVRVAFDAWLLLVMGILIGFYV